MDSLVEINHGKKNVDLAIPVTLHVIENRLMCIVFISY